MQIMKNMHMNCRCRINEPSKDGLSYYTEELWVAM